jgi:hypothetical protein
LSLYTFEREQDVEAGRAALGEPEFDAIKATGEVLTTDSAIGEARAIVSSTTAAHRHRQVGGRT